MALHHLEKLKWLPARPQLAQIRAESKPIANPKHQTPVQGPNEVSFQLRTDAHKPT